MLIRLSVLVCGAVLMAVEILAFLINATTFGSAWREMTAVIAVFLAAMSAGYWLGGLLGDRHPRPITLAATMAGAAGLVGVIPWIARPAKDWVFASRLPFEWHGLAAAFLIYFAPALLLAATSPIGVRLLARSVAGTGTVAGGVAAVSTAGSIGGTIGTGYVLIETLSVDAILYLLALAVAAVAALLALAHRRRLLWPILAIALTAGLPAGAAAQERILHAVQSRYHHIAVVEVGDSQRQLRFNNVVQGTMHPRDPQAGLPEWVDYAYCPLLFAEPLDRVLVIGLASASAPKRFLRDFPRIQVDVVEIDPEVVRVTERFFGLPADPRLSVHVGDGRVFVKRSAGRYDLIVVDAYAASRYGLAVPRHLTTQEFLEEARARLSDRGMLLYNVATYLDLDNRLTRSVARTLRSAFPSVYAWEAESTSNTVFVALRTPQAKTRRELVARARALVEAGTVTLAEFPGRVARLRAPHRTSDAVLLTDQFAPVDRLMRR